MGMRSVRSRGRGRAVRQPESPREAISASQSFAPVAESIPGARTWIRDCLLEWGVDERRTVVELLTTELATNAVLHARSDFHVTVTAFGDDGVRVEVFDGSWELPSSIPHWAEATDTGHRGLMLVRELSRRSGVDETSGGKQIWFEV